MIINTTLDLFKYGTPPKKDRLSDKELEAFLIASPTKKQHQDAFSMGRALLKVPEAEKNRMADEWMRSSGGRDPKGRSLDEEIKLGKQEWLKSQKEEKSIDFLTKTLKEEATHKLLAKENAAIDKLNKDMKKEIRVAKKPLPKDWQPKYLNGNVIDITPLLDDQWWEILGKESYPWDDTPDDDTRNRPTLEEAIGRIAYQRELAEDKLSGLNEEFVKQKLRENLS